MKDQPSASALASERDKDERKWTPKDPTRVAVATSEMDEEATRHVP